MFPIDWRLAADLCQKILAAEGVRQQPAASAHTEQAGTQSTPSALRRRAGAIVIRLGERLQGTARPADLCPPRLTR